MLIYATTPDADHVLIAFVDKFDPISVSLFWDLCQEAVGWNPTRPTTEYVFAIDPKVERFSEFIFSLDEFCPSKTDHLRLCIVRSKGSF